MEKEIKSEELKIELRKLTKEDYLGLKYSMAEAYSEWDGASSWSERHISKLVEIFPEGQICIMVNGAIAGCALSLIIDYHTFGDNHTYAQITGNYTFSTHRSDGDVLYGIDFFVHPEYRGMRIGRRLYDARKEICERHNLRKIIAGGRIPRYKDHAHLLTPKEYLLKVKGKEIYDPTLSFQLANDFHVRKILKGYLPGDTQSLEYASLLEWNNIFYNEEARHINSKKSVIRLGLAQWQMRPFPDIHSLCEQIEFFVDAVSDYKSDFILFPELFNAPLMTAYNHLSGAEAIREIANFTVPLRDKFIEYAISYNINIITGSMPHLENGILQNVGFLCRRDGTYEMYRKLHVTPAETHAWGMTGGDAITTFDTDCGKIGVLICYDVEFPELSRLLAEQGMQILFVPFMTDTQNGYTRVRSCAQARAIENECYVAIAGSVGNLPKVHHMDIQYAQSAVFTPSDFSFPTNGIKAEATPNTETTLIADVDIDLLKELHNFGAVRNLNDRRLDIYGIVNKSKKNYSYAEKGAFEITA
jgi:predicted amidohydrolase/GNAT superfamily N-acetyltransferase